MPTNLYWISGVDRPRVAIAARPRAGDWLEDEIIFWRAEGVSTVLSLLERDEVEDLALQGEADTCVAVGLAFESLPIPDRGVPGSRTEFLQFLRDLLACQGPLVIHCRAGIGRSALVAASLLVLKGFPAAVAFDLIGTARGLQVPDTDEQRQWVETLEASLT